MIPQKQAFLHRPDEDTYGDCDRTCYAMILNWKRDDVPNWNHGNPNTETFYARRERWLDSIGLCSIRVPYSKNNTLEQVLGAQKIVNPNIYYILGGLSKNNTNHSVVCYNDQIVGDPAIDNSGIIGPMDNGYWEVEYIAHRIIKGL